jgi:hypothetical protein
LPTIVSRCEAGSTWTPAIEGSRTTAAIGAIAEPTVKFTADPTGTEAASGCTVIGGGVGVTVGAPAAGCAGEAPGNGEALLPGMGDALGAGAGLG